MGDESTRTVTELEVKAFVNWRIESTEKGWTGFDYGRLITLEVFKDILNNLGQGAMKYN